MHYKVFYLLNYLRTARQSLKAYTTHFPPDPRPELDTPSYQILENTLVGSGLISVLRQSVGHVTDIVINLPLLSADILITVINAVSTTDAAGHTVSNRLQFYMGQVRLGVNTSRSEVDVLDDVSARLTVHNVSRNMSGDNVTCLVTGYDVGDHVVSSDVNVRVAGTPRLCYHAALSFLSVRRPYRFHSDKEPIFCYVFVGNWTDLYAREQSSSQPQFLGGA